MHFAVDLDVLYDVAAIGLQSAVEVVQVADAAHPSGRSIEELCGKCLRQRVIALLLVAGNQVVAVFGNHSVEFGNLIGRVLKVGIHCDDHISLGCFEPTIEGRTLAIVAAERNSANVGRLMAQLVNDLPGVVG